MNEDNAKLLVCDAVAEAGLEKQFNRHLQEMRRHYADAKAGGGSEELAHALALAYFTAEIQNEQ